MRGFGRIYAECHRLAHARAHAVGQNAVARLKIRNLIEEDTGTLLVMVEHLGDSADVFLGTGTSDVFQLAERVYQPKPIPQITPLRSGGLCFSLLGHLFASS